MHSHSGEWERGKYEIAIEYTFVKFKIYDIPSHLVLLHFAVEWEIPFRDETYKLSSFFTLDRINLVIDDGKAIKTEVISKIGE